MGLYFYLSDMKITLKGNKYEVHFSLKAQMLWEAGLDKPFAPSTFYEIWLYYYCIVVACNPELEGELSLEMFLEEASKDPSIGETMLQAASGYEQKKKTNLFRRLLSQLREWAKSLLS